MENRYDASESIDSLELGATINVLKKLFNIPNIAFVLAVIVTLLPGNRSDAETFQGYLLGLLLVIQGTYMVNSFLKRTDELKKFAAGDIATMLYFFLVMWEVSTSKLDVLENFLFPVPGQVVYTFISELPVLMECLFSSLQILGAGFGLALVTAIPLALISGWRKRVYAAVNPLTKVLGPIPSTVYIPYAIALLPTFKFSSIFIIFVGAFWPIFINTLNGTFSVDKRIIDSAKVLNVKEKSMLFEIILPAVTPAIISGATLGLVFSFILLTAAEMIGASSGLGWYVKYFSDFADYPRVLAGIIFIGMVVTVITAGFEFIERRLLIWRD